MDCNLVVLAGRLSAPLEVTDRDSGHRVGRLLMAVRSDTPAVRLDLVPVIWWNPTDHQLDTVPPVGSRVDITGSVQRRFWEGPDGRRSRLEVVAGMVTFPSTSTPDKTGVSGP
jgi:single-stranded DNA-binding protein